MAGCRLLSARRGPARCRAAAARGFSAWATGHYSCLSTPMRSWSPVRTAPEAKKALVPAVVTHCKRDRPAMCASVLTGASPPMRA